MPKFSWEAETEEGDSRQGVMEAPSAQEVDNRLRQSKLTPSKISKQGGFKLDFLGRNVPTKTLVVFTRQLATMIDAGLPLVQCLDILSQGEPHPYFKTVLAEVRASVEGGTTFADALKKHPKVFDNLFCNLVAAGELGGILDTILNRLAAYTEKSMATQMKVKKAMKYPVTVLIVALGITYGLITNVIPTFGGMFKSMGKKDLPAITEFMMKLSDQMIYYMPYIATCAALLIVAYKKFYATPRGRLIFDKIFINSPVFGNLIKKTAVSKFTRTMGTLISSGVPILDALEIVAATAGNKVVENAILHTRDRISEGKSMTAPLLESGVFPKMVVQMIGVGETTGAMDVMLNKIADFYDDEVDQAIDGMMAMLEPMIMVLLGGIIGSVMMAMYLPIFSMGDALSSD